jgi:hypothetical protein
MIEIIFQFFEIDFTLITKWSRQRGDYTLEV